jgi:hypothetical protein
MMKLNPLATVAGLTVTPPNKNTPSVATRHGASTQREGLQLTVTNELIGEVWDKQDKETKTLMVQRSKVYEHAIHKLLPPEKASRFMLSPAQLMMQDFFGMHLSRILNLGKINNTQTPVKLYLEPKVELATHLEVLQTKPKEVIQVKSPVLELPIKELNYRKFNVQALKATPQGGIRDKSKQAFIDYTFKESLRHTFADLFETGHLRINY